MTTLAICENGHLVSFSVVTASVRTHLFEDGRVDIMGMPVATVELLPNFCRDCGGEVLAEAASCSHAIPQNSHPQDALPSFCESCGEPYPWASREQPIAGCGRTSIAIRACHRRTGKSCSTRSRFSLRLRNQEPSRLASEPLSESRTSLQGYGMLLSQSSPECCQPKCCRASVTSRTEVSQVFVEPQLSRRVQDRAEANQGIIRPATDGQGCQARREPQEAPGMCGRLHG